ncbi:MAG: cyclic nucleotide-binding domain-containing protein [Chloroflexi bacterium]|nr:cyclic nucleotide-binding domain-containing protein [Chloroflexota bacterium]
MWFKRRSDKVEVLQKVPLFQNLSKRDLDQVAKIADEVQSQPGEVLMRQGEPGREFILVADGGVRIERNGEVVEHRGPGEFLGELALLDGKARTATVITEKPSTLLVIHWGRFWPLLETVPGVQRKLLIGLAGRMREVLDRVD